MRKARPHQAPFVVARETPRADLAGYVADHPAVLGEGFEALATFVPLPDGEEIALLGIRPSGTLTAVDILDGERRTFYRLGRIVAFLRSRSDWLRRSFPEKSLSPERNLGLVVLGGDFSPSFVDAVAGLALTELVLLRVRDLESTDGRRILLVEREQGRWKENESEFDGEGLSAEEEEFFRRLEEESDDSRPQEGAG